MTSGTFLFGTFNARMTCHAPFFFRSSAFSAVISKKPYCRASSLKTETPASMVGAIVPSKSNKITFFGTHLL